MKYSAGIIPFRRNNSGEFEFLLGHPGGDVWKDVEYWSYLKGGVEDDETWEECAMREFKEESGINLRSLTNSDLIPLGSVMQNKTKTVIAFGIYCPNIDPSNCCSNMADNGLNVEIDKYAWMTFDEVSEKTHPSHIVFFRKIIEMVS